MTSEKETPSTHVTVDMAQLASLIASTVKQVLDSQHGNASQKSLGETIGKSVAEGMAKHSRPKVSFGQYIKKVHSSTHPDPNFPDGPPLKREAWINGLRAERHQLSDTEINLLNRLSRTGRYVDRLVEVVVGQDGVEIRYNDSTTDHRNTNNSKWRTTAEMLELIVTAMDVENAEEAAEFEEKQEKKRRHFGDNKASREARAIAEAK